jgi:NAD(P)-dependent dehydrogenase (short-subunit alcohol dehydrogenase family)
MRPLNYTPCMSGRLANKTAIITGAGSGIGRAIALAFANEGANVVLVGRRKAKLDETAQAAGGSTLVLPADVTQSSDISKVLQQTTEHFGGINVLVNNAGLLHPGTAEQITEAQWDETFNVNVRGLWLFSRAVLPYLRENHGGSIINVASVLGINGVRLRAAYAASKGAVVLLTKCMALDHGSEQIRVNAICPGFVETELTDALLQKATDPEAFLKQRIAVHPIGRVGKPEDIAGMAVYLASDESSWVTGTAFPVDGGYLAV